MFRAYGDDFLQVGERRFNTGLLIHQGKISAPWGPERLRELAPEHLTSVIAAPPEVLLIGTGRTTVFPGATVLEMLATAHIGCECMDTRAAARTYNILAAEGRDVSAAMLLPTARP